MNIVSYEVVASENNYTDFTENEKIKMRYQKRGCAHRRYGKISEFDDSNHLFEVDSNQRVHQVLYIYTAA